MLEGDIAEFINSLRINDLRTVAARFQVVADLTSGAFEERKDQLTPRDLRLIEQIARKNNNKHYRQIMREIIVGVGKGRYGIHAVHLTTTVAVGMIFRWSHEYFSALDVYKENLRMRERSLLERSASRNTRERSALCLPGDQ